MLDAGYLEINGELVASGAAHISALDRGFALSDGVFETIRVTANVPFRLAQHLARLRLGAGVLRLPIFPSDGDLGRAIDRVLRANALREAVVRVTISRGVPSQRGLLPSPEPSRTIVVQATAFHQLPSDRVASGFRLVTSGIRRNEHSPTSRVKACNYLDNVLARIAAHEAGADEALLLNTGGNVACCSSANIYIVRDGVVSTPALACGVLAGITRDAIRELASGHGYGWEETVFSLPELWSADEVFLTNSVLGVVPVTAVDGRAIGTGAVGPIATKLRIEAEAMVRDTIAGR